jgi:hypothetical protein
MPFDNAVFKPSWEKCMNARTRLLPTSRIARLVNHTFFRCCAVLVLLYLLAPGEGKANSGYMATATGKYPAISGTKLGSCNLCHTSSIPSLNSFGAAFRTAGRNAAALAAIENLDSDGDTFTNIVEIRALTFPGDAADHPQQASTTTTTTPSTTTTIAASTTSTTAPSTTTTTAPTTSTTTTSLSTTTTTSLLVTTTTLPPPLLGSETILNFPQVALGGGYRAYLVLGNQGDAPSLIRASFYSSDGQSMALSIGGSMSSTFEAVLPAHGGLRLALKDSGRSVRTGWCQVIGNGSIGGLMIYQSHSEEEMIISQASVFPSSGMRRFAVLMTHTDDHSETGIALVNTGKEVTEVVLRFVDFSGAEIARSTISMHPGTQIARFITQIFDHLPEDIDGTLEVAAGQDIAAVSLLFQEGVFTSVPVIPLP